MNSAGIQHITNLKHQYFQGKSAKQINLNQMIDQLRMQSFPNELLYLIDTKNLDILSLTENESSIFEKRGFELREVEQLYEDIQPNDEQKIIEYAKFLVHSAFSKNRTFADGSFSEIFYKSNTNQFLLKRTKTISDGSGNILYTLGSIQNMSGVFPGELRNAQFNFLGQNAEELKLQFNGLDEYQQILSKREIQILKLISHGLTSKALAIQLYISKETVDRHRKNIIKKLETSNTIEAYNKALDMGLLKF